MKFRDFVEVTRDALESLAFGLEGERDITPMLHLESQTGVDVVGIDPDFFTYSGGMELLLKRFVIPLIKEHRARQVAWTYCAWEAPEGGALPADHPDRREILAAVFIDPEVVEHWIAPIIRTGGRVIIGPWESVKNASGGHTITDIQEVLR